MKLLKSKKINSIITLLVILLIFILGFIACNIDKKANSQTEKENLIGKVELPELSDSIKVKSKITPKRKELVAPKKTEPIKSTVPKNISSNQPDFKSFTNIIEKKKAFFNFMRPFIIDENNKVIDERNYTLSCVKLLEESKELSENEIKKLENLAVKYRTKISDYTDVNSFKGILMRVDVIPVELALAQSSNESAWGTSYFSTKGNNMFGQWCFTKDCGIVPRQRAKGTTHEVAVFNDVGGSVYAYIKNLNSHPAYKQLRTVRYKMRQEGKTPTGHALAIGLQKYSGIGMEYVNTLRSMIRVNKKYMGLEK